MGKGLKLSEACRWRKGALEGTISEHSDALDSGELFEGDMKYDIPPKNAYLSLF